MLGPCAQEVLDSKGIIIFFYPRANTPGCTTQACGLSEAFPDITAAGFELFGMSADKPKPQATWKVTPEYAPTRLAASRSKAGLL